MEKSRSDLKKLKTEARELKTQLNSIFGKADLDQEKFGETLMKLADIRKQQYIEMVQMKVKVREVFTKDQIKILLAEYPGIFNLSAKRSDRADPRSKGRKPKTLPEKK